MKCFECGATCATKYIQGYDGLVIAVCKVCPKCDWESFHTKVPEAI
jgi:hypothetical protein